MGPGNQKFFRVDISSGEIRGIATMSFDEALDNLPADQRLIAFDQDINPDFKRWDQANLAWVDKPLPPPMPYDKMRWTGFSGLMPDQMGAVMKIMGRFVRGEQPTEAEIAEFEHVEAAIDNIKFDHPAPVAESDN